MKNLSGFSLMTALLIGSSWAQAAEFSPTDHGGADLILQDGDVIWGLHQNVGRFEIPVGAEVDVSPYDGVTTGSRGRLEVQADDIIISGFLDARGAGYSGGGGGGGGGAALVIYSPGPQGPPEPQGAGAPGGVAPYAGMFIFSQERTELDGRQGGRGGFGFLPFDPTPRDGVPGSGGVGDGPFGGSLFGSRSNERVASQDGGYAGKFFNRDNSTDRSTDMGSGAAGITGSVPLNPGFETNHDQNPPPGFPAGYSGGNGGGEIRLFATNSFLLTSTGSIRADGALGNPPVLGEGEPLTSIGTSANGATGGNVLPVNLSGFEGNEDIYNTDIALPPAGAGGGILIDVAGNGSGTIETDAEIVSMGGRDPFRDVSSNGGTIKIFGPQDFSIGAADIRASRIIRPDFQDPIGPDPIYTIPEFTKTPDGRVMFDLQVGVRIPELDFRSTRGEATAIWSSDSGEGPFEQKENFRLPFILNHPFTLEHTKPGVSFDPGEIWTFAITFLDDQGIESEEYVVRFEIGPNYQVTVSEGNNNDGALLNGLVVF